MGSSFKRRIECIAARIIGSGGKRRAEVGKQGRKLFGLKHRRFDEHHAGPIRDKGRIALDQLLDRGSAHVGRACGRIDRRGIWRDIHVQKQVHNRAQITVAAPVRRVLGKTLP
jgi:hypothetical protein